jgi:uncharacterized protein (DUF2336 family)
MDYLKSFPALEGLVDLANRDDVDISPTLLRVLTDMYVLKPAHSADDERQYTELALRLLDAADVAARQSVALKLANYPQAPLKVVRKLACDVFVVAEPILRHSQRLSSADLALIARELSGGHAALIAAREGSAQHIRPPAATTRSDPFAGTDAAGNELSDVFLAANAAERRLILLNLHYAPLGIAKPIMPALAAEAVRRLEATALSHNIEAFVREFARALSVSQDLARRLANDSSGETIVVAARALGMPAAVLQRILLCLNPVISQSVQRVHDLADLYEQLKPEAALRMLGLWQSIVRRPQTSAHQPQFYDDESRRRPEGVRPEARPAPAATKPAGDRRFDRTNTPDPRAGTKRIWR